MKTRSVATARLEALCTLSSRLAVGPLEQLCTTCLEVLLEGSHAGAGLVLRGDDLAVCSQRGFPPAADPVEQALRESICRLAALARQKQSTLQVSDLRLELPEPAQQSATYRSALVLPVASPASVGGVIVLLFDECSEMDADTLRFCETVARLLSLAHGRERLEEDRGRREEAEDAQRLASMGLLTATVAHELRGPAGALVLQLEEQARLLNQLEMLGGTSDTPIGGLVAELSELTADMETAIGRVRDTAEQLSTMSRRESAFEHLDVSNLVRESLSLIRPHLERRGIVLHERLGQACVTKGRRDSLTQVVLNLVFNAADACETANAMPEVRVTVAEEGEQLLLQVEDTGPGVAEDAVRTIFKPFYTTKQRGKGTGLGLKICSDVVAQHGGHIEVSNLPAGGASFRVYLPRLVDDSGVHAVSVTARPIKKVSHPVRRRQIFVVDDDPVFSRTVRRAFKPHDVRMAATASEAETALLDKTYTPDLVLCDVFLPGAHGNVLHARIVARRPDLRDRFVFVTGGALGKPEADYVRSVGCRTLFKPIDLRRILAELDDPEESRTSPNSVLTLAGPQSSRLDYTATAPPKRR